MSSALSAAKKRRAQIDPVRPVGGSAAVAPSPVGPTDTQGLTLPQVIALIDKRLIHLEHFSKGINTTVQELQNNGVAVSSNDSVTNNEEFQSIQSILDDMNSRFDIMAEEIANMKNIVLSLQSYTMNVNKMLLQNLQSSDLGVFTLSNNDTTSTDGADAADNTTA